MRRLGTLFTIGIFLTILVGCREKAPQADSPVERGKYLVWFGGCHDCHSPKVAGPGGIPLPDEKRLLSGHPEKDLYPVWMPAGSKAYDNLATTSSMMTAWAGPWGVSFATNLTPDKETGIGEWSEESFMQSMRTGKHQGQPNGRDILPPMPWPNLKELTDADLKAIWAYLRSIPPIKNQVPLPIPPAQSGKTK